jgi:hypothetical protein
MSDSEDIIEEIMDLEGEDIVDELRAFAFIVDKAQGVAEVKMLSGSIFLQAAEEIERLREALGG